ncbi:MAG: thiamine diphosphokinase [Trueperaceae bacterium]|nr:thiamine diphosphokinase [Trueperaceae bacterium]
MTALVLAGGAVHATARLRAAVRDATLVIAADGGLRHAAALGVTPDRLVGDLDSVREADRAAWPGLAVEAAPADKDVLDLELALDAARARGATRTLVVGAFGGRLDQSLAAAQIAARRAERGEALALLDGLQDVHPVAAGGALDLPLPAGTTFSLVGFGDVARVSVGGAAYPLDAAALPRGVGRGVSNVAEGDGTRVDVHAGVVLVVVLHDVVRDA